MLSLVIFGDQRKYWFTVWFMDYLTCCVYPIPRPSFNINTKHTKCWYYKFYICGYFLLIQPNANMLVYPSAIYILFYCSRYFYSHLAIRHSKSSCRIIYPIIIFLMYIFTNKILLFRLKLNSETFWTNFTYRWKERAYFVIT